MEKFKKGKSYTYEEIEEIFENARELTIMRPTGGYEERNSKYMITMMMSSVVILHEMEKNLFDKEENDNDS